MYASNNRTLKYEIKLMRIKGETDKFTIITRDFNTFISIIDRVDRKLVRILES